MFRQENRESAAWYPANVALHFLVKYFTNICICVEEEEDDDDDEEGGGS